MNQSFVYSFKVNCSDCNFRLSINDRTLYHLDRGANVNAELQINTYLLFANNKFNCEIVPPRGINTIPESANITLNLIQNTIGGGKGQGKTIATFQTPSYKSDSKNPPKTNDGLSGDLKTIMAGKSVFETGLQINNNTALKTELYEKYRQISDLLKNEDIVSVLELFKTRNKDVAGLTGRKEEDIRTAIKKDYTSYVTDTSLALWDFSPEKVSVKIYGNNKLACLEVANGNQPICFINRKDRIAIYIPLYFFRNPISKELEIIR